MSVFTKIVHYSSVYRISSHILFWLVVFVVPQYEEGMTLRNMLIENIFCVFFYMLASYFVTYFIIPKLLRGDNYLIISLYFIVGSYLISALLRTMVIYVLEPIVRTPPFEQEPILEILTDIPVLIKVYSLQYFSLAWIFGFIKLLKDQYLIKQHTLLLEKEKMKAELNTLKAQLNPHFLFNTLNNIYSLSLVNSPITSRSIAGLSEILDHVLYRCNRAYVPISTEITLLKNYIELEKLRYDERLQVNFNHAIDEDSEIAPLILLSIVENAFKHGADVGRPTIDIELVLLKKQFNFKVSNAFVAKQNDSRENKIGLTNISKQLELIYPEQHTFNLATNDNIFVASLHINLIQSRTNITQLIDESEMSFSR